MYSSKELLFMTLVNEDDLYLVDLNRMYFFFVGL